ncbi:MAG: LamG-like jellyroll fold domain-containing protein, partial [Gammaproteobacteria bacterium]
MKTSPIDGSKTLCKSTSFLFLLFLILYLSHSPLNADTVIVDNGFETGDLSGFRCSGNCPTVVTSPVANGAYSGNFNLTPNMATSYRTEVELTNGKGYFAFGQEYRLGLNYRYEDWAIDSSGEIAPFQIHTRPSSWSGGCNVGTAVTTAPFFMLSVNDEVRFITYGDKILWRGAVEKNQWLYIEVHFVISSGSDGFIEAWKDGVLLGRVDGANSPEFDNCQQPMRTPFLKMGVYKWDWTTKTTESDRRQLFIDNLKILLVDSAPVDTTPPMISNVQAAITNTTVTITWTTDEASDSVVNYGTTTDYGNTGSDAALDTSHSVNLTGLSPNTLYHFEVSSTDTSSNMASSGDMTFTTGSLPTDTTPPMISEVRVSSITDNSATVTWTTDEAADSVVNYGTTPAYGSTAGDPAWVITHSATLTGLISNTVYHFRISSTDADNNTGNSVDLTFSTLQAINPDLVAYWPMDPGTGSTLPDMSGNGHTGTLVNGAVLTTSGGVLFDGVDDYVDVGQFDIPGNAMTIAAWFWADDLANCSFQDCRIISKATGIQEQDHYFMVSPVIVNSEIRLRFRIKTNGATSTLAASSGSLSNQTWFHVAAVYDGQSMRLYKDGIEVGSKSKSGSLTTNSDISVWLGSNPPNATSRPWKGQIDDVRIYNYALTNEEILALTSTPTNPPAISDIQVTSITTDSAIVTWTTDEASDSVVDYGTTAAYGSTGGDPALVTSHSVTLTGLNSGTLYHFETRSTDADGNTASSGDLTFTTASAPPVDTTPPAISDIQVTSITTDSAIVTWTTDEASDSVVDYGTTAAYGSTGGDPALVTS